MEIGSLLLSRCCEAVLTPEDVSVKGNSFSFNLADVYVYDGSDISESFLVEDEFFMSAEYVDGRWLISAEDLVMAGNSSALSAHAAE